MNRSVPGGQEIPEDWERWWLPGAAGQGQAACSWLHPGAGLHPRPDGALAGIEHGR